MSHAPNPKFGRSERLVAIAESLLRGRDTYSQRAIMALLLEQAEDDASTVVEPQGFTGCIYIGSPAASLYDGSGVCEDDVEYLCAAALAYTATSADGSPIDVYSSLRHDAAAPPRAVLRDDELGLADFDAVPI